MCCQGPSPPGLALDLSSLSCLDYNAIFGMQQTPYVCSLSAPRDQDFLTGLEISILLLPQSLLSQCSGSAGLNSIGLLSSALPTL